MGSWDTVGDNQVAAAVEWGKEFAADNPGSIAAVVDIQDTLVVAVVDMLHVVEDKLLVEVVAVGSPLGSLVAEDTGSFVAAAGMTGTVDI